MEPRGETNILNKAFETLSGKVQYSDISFCFVFDGNELLLIPPNNKKNELKDQWIKPHCANSFYATSYSMKMQEPYLIGSCSKNGHGIVFLTQPESQICSEDLTIIVNVKGYIDFDADISPINKIAFRGPEIDHIYPINQAYEHQSSDVTNFGGRGFSMAFANPQLTETPKQEFIFSGQTIQAFFSISEEIGKKDGDPPLKLSPTISFEFKETSDYTFIYDLWCIAKRFVQYLCNRQNVYFPTTELFINREAGEYNSYATLHVLEETSVAEYKCLADGRYISYSYLSGHEGAILSDIASNSLYIRHLPSSYKDGCLINGAKFIMITAAFEREFDRMHPGGIPKSKKREDVETQAINLLQKLVEENEGKLKKEFKRLKKLVQSTTLETKIIKIGEEIDPIVGIFGKTLYENNGEKLDYKKMGKRVADERNAFAHGNLDKKFAQESLIDFIYLQYIIYAMQLKNYGIEDMQIQRAVNDLFCIGYHLND